MASETPNSLRFFPVLSVASLHFSLQDFLCCLKLLMLTGLGHLCLLCIDNLTQSSAFTFQSPAHGLRSSPESQMHGNSLLSISTGSLIEVSNLACSKCSSCFKPTTPVPFPVFLTSLSNSSIYPVASTQKPSSQTLIPLFLLPISLSSVQFSRSVVPNSL